MINPLAIVLPVVGAKSETFIQRHVNELTDTGTPVITPAATPVPDAVWLPRGPALYLGSHEPFFPQRATLWLEVLGHCGTRTYQEARMLRFLRKHRVTTLLCQYMTYGHPLLAFARKFGLRYFVHAHGYDVSDYCLNDPAWRVRYQDYNQADGIITMSEISRARLVDSGLGADLVHVIPYGVDVPDQRPGRPAGNAVRCLAVGRMTPKKAPLLLLESFAKALTIDRNLKLDYVGEGELFPAASRFVRDQGLSEAVTLHGGVPNKDVQTLLAACDIFIQHSVTDPATGDQEGLPVAILEAMACGLPVVSTWHAGIQEAVEQHQTGILVQEGDTTSMAAAITKLAADPELREAMGRSAHARAQSRFSWEREKASLLRLLECS